MTNFGMIDLFKELIEVHKERLIELDYYEELIDCFDTDAIYAFGRIKDVLDDLIDSECEEDEELGLYLLKNLYSYWDSEMAMYRKALHLEILHYISDNKEVLEKHLDIRELHRHIEFNDVEQKEYMKYLDSKRFYIEDMARSEYDTIQGLKGMVKRAKEYQGIIEYHAGTLLEMNGYYNRKK